MPTKQKTIWMLAVAFLVTVLLGLLLWFVYEKIKDDSKIVAGAKLKIAGIEKQEQDLAQAVSAIETLKDDIAEIESGFLTQKGFVAFMELLEGIAKRTGNKFRAESAILPAQPLRPETLFSNDPSSITFSLESDFISAINFLALFEKIPFSGFIDELSINGAANKTTARIHYMILSYKF